MRDWVKSGAPWIWLTAGAVAVALVLVFGVLWLTAARGLVHFWPKPVVETTFIERDGREMRLIGEVREREEVPVRRLQESGFNIESEELFATRYLFKLGNRDVYGVDFRWFPEPLLGAFSYPQDLITVERREWGNFYGYLKAVKEGGVVVAEGAAAWPELQTRVDRANRLFRQIYSIEKYDIGRVNFHLERLRLQERKLELRDQLTPALTSDFEQRREEHMLAFRALQDQIQVLRRDIDRDSLTAEVQTGQLVDIPLSKVADAYRANAMSFFHKVGFYFHKLWEFMSDDPREANTEGGIFPAIFGTVMMVILMSIMVTPLGVVAAVYMREYAKQGPLIRVIRISVNNLAGVPSIVYGVFGLGFFVYVLGHNIDQLFFPEALPAPTFGSPGILWASLTLAILTLPVVIVSTRRHQGGNAVAHGAADGEPGDDDRADSRGCAGGRRGRAADAGRRGETCAEPADGRFLSLRASRAQVHASRFSHLRRRLPKPERGSRATAGVCDRASAGAGDRGAQPDRNIPAQPPARALPRTGRHVIRGVKSCKSRTSKP
jgi:phosphate transport system permease protein